MQYSIPDTRSSLILRLHDPGDHDAWETFVSLYQPVVLRLARRMNLQDADAADATQEVMSRVAKVVEQWEPDRSKGTFRGWLYRVARNVMLRWIEKHRRQTAGSGDSGMQFLLQTHPNPESAHALDIEYMREVFTWATKRVCHEFQPATWQAFIRTFVGGQSVADVAADLKISVGAVYVARSRVMRRLRVEVTQYANPDWMSSGFPQEEDLS